MKNLSKILLIISILLFSKLLMSQEKQIDSLQSLLSNTSEKNRAEILNQLSAKYKNIDLEKSFKYASEALKNAKKFNNQKENAEALKCLGSIFIYKKELNKALTYYYESQKLKQELGDNKGVADLFYNIAYIQKKLDKFENSIIYYKKAKTIYETENLPEEVADASRSIGQLYFFLGNFENATAQFEQAFKISEELKDEAGKANSLQMLGIIYQEWAKYENALDYYQKAIKIFENIDDKVGVANTLNNIGLVYKDWGKYSDTDFGVYEEKALENLKKSFDLMQELNDKYGMANSLVNIGSIYEKIDSVDLALENYHKALEFEEEINDKNGIAGTLENIGVILSRKKDDNKNALEYLKKSLNIRKELSNKQGIASALQNIGSIYSQMGNYSEATLYLNQSLSLARELNKKELIKDIYDAFSNIYRLQQNYKLSLEYYQKFVSIKDSMFTEDSHKRITEIETKYETDKKQKEIELLNNKQKLDTEQIKNQRNLIYLFIIVFIIVILFSVLLYRQYHQKKIANILLGEQKQEIQAQRDLATEQRDMITIQKQEITDSILYARRIQSAILPPVDILAENVPEHFILYKPRDIVSGDFYWMNNRNNRTIIAAADCTGHGVPGAFMSLLGVAFLNEIVNTNDLLKSNQILDLLRANIIKSLHQTGKEGEAKDGMDISLVIIDRNTNKIEYSGAYNPLYLIRNKTNSNFISNNENNSIQFEDDDTEFIEIKADKMPISIHVSELKPFSNNIFELEDSMKLYLFSDGYADQFGGEKGKKFKYKRFQEILFENRNNSMQNTKTILNSTFDNWIGNHEQIDDIIVIGVKL